MSHQLPRALGRAQGIAATALRRLTGAAETAHEHANAIERAIVPGAQYRSGRWLVRIDDDPDAASAPPWAFCYNVKAVSLALTLSEGGCLTAIGTTTAIPSDVATSGPAVNLYEVLNTSTSADGIDPTNFPGTVAPLPVVGLAECWHLRLESGQVIRVFAKGPRIDGDCEAP